MQNILLFEAVKNNDACAQLCVKGYVAYGIVVKATWLIIPMGVLFVWWKNAYFLIGNGGLFDSWVRFLSLKERVLDWVRSVQKSQMRCSKNTGLEEEQQYGDEPIDTGLNPGQQPRGHLSDGEFISNKGSYSRNWGKDYDGNQGKNSSQKKHVRFGTCTLLVDKLREEGQKKRITLGFRRFMVTPIRYKRDGEVSSIVVLAEAEVVAVDASAGIAAVSELFKIVVSAWAAVSIVSVVAHEVEAYWSCVGLLDNWMSDGVLNWLAVHCKSDGVEAKGVSEVGIGLSNGVVLFSVVLFRCL